MVASLTFAVLFVGSSAATTFDAPVVRVVDGDSLIVLVDRQQMRIRLKEIDAPELKQPFGKRSRQSLATMCAAKQARVIWSEKDRNGRLLARVWCSGIDANTEQVRRGMAWVFDRYVKDRSLYPLARRRAILTARLVGGRGAGSALGMAPSEGRARIRGAEVGAAIYRAINAERHRRPVGEAARRAGPRVARRASCAVYDFDPTGWMLFRMRDEPRTRRVGIRGRAQGERESPISRGLGD